MVILFLIGVGCWLLQYKYQRWVLHMVPAETTFFKLIAYLCFFTIPYLFFLKIKKFWIANTVVVIPVLILIEFTCFLLLGSPDRLIKNFEQPDISAEDLKIVLGDAPFPDDTIHDVKEGVFDVQYMTDEYSRRITPGYDSSRTSYALFFGCSIAFGYGVNQDETMAYYYQNYANCNSKNYGYNGYGSNQILARFQHEDLSQQVEEKEGVAYYLFFWDHIRRSIGTMNRYNEWLANAPYYYLEDGELKRDGTFRSGRGFISGFYEYAYRLNTIRYFGVDFPVKLNENHYNLVSEIILETKKEYAKQFGNDEFYLVFYPSWKDYEEEELTAFKSYLDAKGVEYFDLNTFMEYQTENSLGEDPHPNAETNKVLAEELYRRYTELKH